MENILQNIQNKNKIKIKNSIPVEMLVDIFKAFNINKIITKTNVLIINETTAKSEWKNFSIKFTTSSTIFYIYLGQTFKKILREFKVRNTI